MNVTKLVLLGALEEIGEGSGYDILQALERKMIHKWIDVKVGSIYYTMKQLHQEGMIREVAETQEGNYPTKVIYTIEESGQRLFDELQAMAFKGLFPNFFGFKVALKFNTRKRSDEVAAFAAQAIAVIDRYLTEMDAYLGTLDPTSPRHEYDAFFIEHDRRLFQAEKLWITEAVRFTHTRESMRDG